MKWFKKILVVVLIGFLTVQVSFAQQSTEYRQCGTTEAIEQSLLEHPELIENMRRLDKETREYLTGEKALDSVLTVPVVFHVFHLYGTERISEAQMKDCIRIMNEDFLKKNADTSSVIDAFKGIIGEGKIRFRLAKKDPTGKCTKGINYIYSPLTTSGGENLKNVISWDTKRYLNIWVCQNVASGAAAYSYYPGTAPGQSHEGVVSLSTYVGSIGTSNNGYNARTLTHEVGHYFNLPHTWGSSNTPGAANNCNSDDGVADTPNCIGVTGSGCPLTQASCGPVANVQNQMEYSNCRKMFTKGQVTRMHAAIKSSVGFRSSLWTGSNLIFTGTTNDGPGPECPPTTDFKSSFTRVCPGSVVTFTQLIYNVDDLNGVQFKWTFDGATPSTSTAKVQQVTYDQPGIYDVKLVVENAAGKDSAIRTGMIKVLASETGYVDGENESFESTTFPLFPANPTKNWDIVSSLPTNTWKRTTTAKVTGTASLMIANTQATTGNIHTLYSPVFEILGSLTGAKLALKYAYARRTATNTDKLVVSYSVDCGKTWNSATSRTGATLSTIGGNLVTGNFVPTATQWTQLNLNLNFLNNNPKVRFKFEFTSGGGNNIYLEDIQVTALTGITNLQDENLALVVVPNPSIEGLPRLIVDVVKPSAATLEIVDIIGKSTLLKKSIFLDNGRTEFDLKSEMDKPKSGSYWVRLVVQNRVMVRQMVIMP